MKKEIIEWTRKNIEEYIVSLELELYDIEYVKEGPNYYLRIYIDKESGVSIDDCEKVHRFIENKLDEADPINNPYILEVSSVGIDKPLKTPSDYEKYRGRKIDVKLYKAVNYASKNAKSSSGHSSRTQNKIKEFCGILIDNTQDAVVLQTDDGEIKLNFKEIASCKLSVI
jgi:ribosome maturation factor RimP